jgi:hypothetical protein
MTQPPKILDWSELENLDSPALFQLEREVNDWIARGMKQNRVVCRQMARNIKAIRALRGGRPLATRQACIGRGL